MQDNHEGEGKTEEVSISAFLSDALSGCERRVFTYLDFDPYFIFTDSKKITNDDLKEFSDLIFSFGYGLEPDIRYKKFLAKPTDELVVFKTDTIPDSLSSEYKLNYILLYIIGIFAAYDLQVSEDEYEDLSKFVDTRNKLEKFEKDRLHSMQDLFATRVFSISELEYLLKKIPQYKNEDLITLIFDIILSDKVIHQREKYLLRRIYELLEVDSTTPIRDLQKFAREREAAATENVIEDEQLLSLEEIDRAFDDIFFS